MNYYADSKPKEIEKSFIYGKDLAIVVLLGLIGSCWNYVPYSNLISIILQTFVLGTIFVVYRKRPVMLIVAYILLNILPSQMYGGFIEAGRNYYTLNPKICITFSLLFCAYGMIILKQSYRIRLSILFFIILMTASLVWTISLTSYNIDFWWMCAAYILFPMFIKEDKDVRLVLIAYVVAVDIFCIEVLPILLSNINLHRGMVNLDANYAAFFIVISIVIILILFTQYKELLSARFTIFLLGSSIVYLITMAYFASRTSFIMLIILLILYLLFNVKSLKIMILSVIGVVLSYLLLHKYGVFNTLFLRFGEANVFTGGGRLEIQRELLVSFSNFDFFPILFGNGFLTTSHFGTGLQAHNTYISILISFGIIGIIIYCCYLGSIFINLRKSTYRPFLIMFYFLCLYGVALEPYLMVEGILFFALLTAIGNIKPKHVSDNGNASNRILWYTEEVETINKGHISEEKLNMGLVE